MRSFLALVLVSVVAASIPAQITVGPDVIVGSISDVGNYGTDGSGIYAYALGTTVPVINVHTSIFTCSNCSPSRLTTESKITNEVFGS